MSNLSSPSRRSFLAASAATGAALVAVPAIQAIGSDEKLNVGVIGCGHRGRALAREVIKLKHNVVALCDVAQFRLDEISESVVKSDQEKPKEFQDYRKLLAMKSLDAVIIATPDHHHRDQLIAAMEAEKDVYIENPMTKTIEDGKEMVEAVRRTKRIVQAGNQRRSGPHWKHCREIIESNDFGNLVWVKAWDTRNWQKRDPSAIPTSFTKEQEKQVDWEAFVGKAAKREFHANRYWAWRWYWDYAGGLMTDAASQQLDLIQWLGGVESPKSVVTHGGRYLFKQWETPDVVQGVWDYGTFAAACHVEYINGGDGVGVAFYGTKMTLISDMERDIRVYNTTDKITADTEPLKKWNIEPELPHHVKNWLECCKSRKEPHAPVELGHRVALAAHLANLSYRTGKRVYWDADRQEVISS